MSDSLRLTGLYSGMDTDATVKKMIQGEQLRVDKAYQDRQYIEWKKEDYREVASLLRGFEGEYFDVVNSETNLKSSSTFDLFSGTVKENDEISEAVTIKTTSASQVINFTIDSVTRLATKDIYKSGEAVIGTLQSANLEAIGDINTVIGNSTEDITFTLDGVSKTIELNANNADYDALALDLTTKLQEEFSNVDIIVTASDAGPGVSQLNFEIRENDLATVEDGHVLTVSSDNTQIMTYLGLKDGQSNAVDVEKTLNEVFDISGESTFKINDLEFTFADDTEIKDIMAKVNGSSAGVTLSFDSFTDKFTLEANKYGTNNKIEIDDTASGLLGKFKLNGSNFDYVEAKSSVFKVNNVETTRDDNTFEIYGTKITLNSEQIDPVNIEINSSTDETKNMIAKFVDAYNTMIIKLNDKTDEKTYGEFKPLSKAERAELSDDEVKSWDLKARSGMLRNDSSIEKITDDLRRALYESVDGLGISLYEMGISTSNNYKEKGKLIIDEDKLDAALLERPNEVIELFTKESGTTYYDSENRTTRRSENGLAQRIADILKDNVRIGRDTNGKKGYLLEIAGSETGTDSTSLLAKKLASMDTRIDSLLTLLSDREQKYYAQFASMESALARMQSQSSALTQQFGG